MTLATSVSEITLRIGDADQKSGASETEIEQVAIAWVVVHPRCDAITHVSRFFHLINCSIV